ncbi:MAG: radical SAM protein, partial [Anaerolineales bacterium]
EGPAFTPSPPGEAARAIERAAGFDLQRAEVESEKFHEIYLPVGILPPDQYMSVLLQATEGCSFNQCTFCRLYENTRFRIKSIEEFRQHAAAVRDFLGQGLNLHRTVFLGDANALVVPTDRLLDFLKSTSELFPEQAQGGVHGFLDGFSGEKKSIQAYQALADHGLKRVYIGLESGHDPLLKFLNKPGSASDAVLAVRKLKQVGISVGVIILLGAGGQNFAEGHIRDTVEVVSAMGLNLQDQIYFSELIEPQGAGYAQDALSADLGELPSEALERQWREIQAGLHYSEATGTPHMARYDIREFIY